MSAHLCVRQGNIVRAFYVFWFFFCAAWGFLSATFPAESSPGWMQVVVALPAMLLTTLGLHWMELRKLPHGRLVSRPSLKLKPWNRPMGLAMFVGLTFLFSGIWGSGISLVSNASSLRVALQFLAMGVGLIGGCYVACRLFPSKFSV